MLSGGLVSAGQSVNPAGDGVGGCFCISRQDGGFHICHRLLVQGNLGGACEVRTRTDGKLGAIQGRGQHVHITVQAGDVGCVLQAANLPAGQGLRLQIHEVQVDGGAGGVCND